MLQFTKMIYITVSPVCQLHYQVRTVLFAWLKTFKFNFASALLQHPNNFTFNYPTSDEMRECVVLWLDQGERDGGRHIEREMNGFTGVPTENKWMNGTVMKRGGARGEQDIQRDWSIAVKIIGREDMMNTAESQARGCDCNCLFWVHLATGGFWKTCFKRWPPLC